MPHSICIQQAGQPRVSARCTLCVVTLCIIVMYFVLRVRVRVWWGNPHKWLARLCSKAGTACRMPHICIMMLAEQLLTLLIMEGSYVRPAPWELALFMQMQVVANGD